MAKRVAWICSFEGCGRKHSGLGLCGGHYSQRRRGEDLRPITRHIAAMIDRDDQGRKYCRRCTTWKPESAFASSYGKADGLQHRCRECNADIYRGRTEEIRDKMRDARMGVSKDRFDAMLAEQGGRCAICRSDDPGTAHWAVDHDHDCCPDPGRSCGRCIRGLLCSRCNTGIGLLRDDPAILSAAIAYLTNTHHRAANTRGA